MIRASELRISNFEIETRLVCPCCHMGFISVKDEEERFIFPDKQTFKFPRNTLPTCDKCGTGFEIVIDRTLKIKLRKI